MTYINAIRYVYNRQTQTVRTVSSHCWRYIQSISGLRQTFCAHVSLLHSLRREPRTGITCQTWVRSKTTRESVFHASAVRKLFREPHPLSREPSENLPQLLPKGLISHPSKRVRQNFLQEGFHGQLTQVSVQRDVSTNLESLRLLAITKYECTLLDLVTGLRKSWGLNFRNHLALHYHYANLPQAFEIAVARYSPTSPPGGCFRTNLSLGKPYPVSLSGLRWYLKTP